MQSRLVSVKNGVSKYCITIGEEDYIIITSGEILSVNKSNEHYEISNKSNKKIEIG